VRHKRIVAAVKSGSREKAPFFKLATPLKNNNSRAIKSSLIFTVSRREQQLSRWQSVSRCARHLERRRGLRRGVGSHIDRGIDPRHESRRVLPSVREISTRFFSSPSAFAFIEPRNPCDFRFRPRKNLSPERCVLGRFESRARDCRKITLEQGSRFAPETNIRAHRARYL